MIADLDLVKMKKSDVNFSVPYELQILYNDHVHGFVSWFDCHFSDLKYPVTLSTSPYKKPTHWKQTVFYLENAIKVSKWDWIYGSIAVRQSKTNFRELDIKISAHLDSEKNEPADEVKQFKVR